VRCVQRLVRRLAAAAAVAGLAFCILSIWRQWHDARALQLHWSPGWLIGATLAAAVANGLMAAGWAQLVRAGGGQVSWPEALRVWWAGQLARFVPTGLGSVPGRLVVGAGAGLPRRLLVTTTAAELAVGAATSAVAAALLLPGVTGMLLAAFGLAAGIVAAAVVGGRLLPGHPAVARASGYFVAAHALKVLVRAAGFWAMLHVTTAGPPAELLAVIGAVGAAYVLGLVAVFAPGGIGVREAALAGTLGAMPGGSPAAVIAAAVLWRLAETAVEPPLLLATRLIASRSERREAAPLP
jgi:uncharacterized membrane protein YbhN (UPF0104 family)